MNSYGTPSIAIRAIKRINNLKIGWVSDFNLIAAQTRIRVINIHRRLRSIGWDSTIINWDQALNNHYDFIIIGKEFSLSAFQNIKMLKLQGKVIICDICEDLFDLDIPYYKEIIQISDKVMVASTRLKEKLSQLNLKIDVIPDAIETDPEMNLNCAYLDRPLKVVYLGYGGGSVLLEPIKPIIKKLNMELIEIHEWDTATIKWDLNWAQHVLSCDIAIIPQRPEQECKSNNRLTQLMALGLPCVVSPLPAYKELFNNDNFLIAENLEEWEFCLGTLTDWQNRYEVGQRGKQTAIDFTIPKITNLWINFFNQCQRVEIVVPTKNNTEYLEQLIKSLEATNNNCLIELVVVDNSTDDTTSDFISSFCAERGISYVL